MDTELLVDEQIADGQLLVERLIQNNFHVSVAFWVKPSDNASWQFYITSPDVALGDAGEAYQKAYHSLESISVSSISPLNINLLNDSNPVARAAIELRDRLPGRNPARYHDKRLGQLPAKEVYIYPRLEVPLRQSFLVTYVRQGNTNEWVATTQRKEFYRGHNAKGAVSYSTAHWTGEEAEKERFALVYVMIEVASGLDETSILANPIMMIQLGDQAQLVADQRFREKHPGDSITHEALALAV